MPPYRLSSGKETSLTELYAGPFMRHCIVQSVEEPEVEELQHAILAKEDIESYFSVLDAPVPPLDQTRFCWAGNKQTLLPGVASPHSAYLLSAKDDRENQELDVDNSAQRK